MRALFTSLVVLASLLSVARASATPNFPDELQKAWDLPSLPDSPPCLLCHNTPAGGLGTATTPFATYLRSRGLTEYDTASLDNALAADRGEMHDSDGNGVTDYDDLAAGRDPNGAGDASSAERPEYGCAAARSPSDPVSWLAVGLVLVVLRRARLR